MIHAAGNVAVVRTGDVTTLMIQMETDTALDLRSILAKANSEGVGDTSREARQLLLDAEATLQSAFRVARKKTRRRPALEGPTTKLRAVCQIPDCGCSGYAHP